MKTNGSPATGRDLRRKGVPREREHKESRAWLGHPSRFIERPPELRGGAREIPDAVRDDQVEAAVFRRVCGSIGARTTMKSVVESMLIGVRLAAAQSMGHDRSRAHHVPPEGPRAGSALRPAPQPISSTRPSTGALLQLLSRQTFMSTAFGADRANPATVRGDSPSLRSLRAGPRFET